MLQPVRRDLNGGDSQGAIDEAPYSQIDRYFLSSPSLIMLLLDTSAFINVPQLEHHHSCDLFSMFSSFVASCSQTQL